MSAKVYNFFQSNSNKCSPRHLECGFDNPAELFPLRVKTFFAQALNNLKSSRNFFKPKVFLDTVPGKTVFAWKTYSLYKERVCAHITFLFFLKFSNIPFWAVSYEQSMGINLLSVLLVCVHLHTRTHTHIHTHTHTSNKNLTKRPGLYYKKLRKVSMAFAKCPS